MDLRALSDNAKRALVVCASALMLSISAHGPVRAGAVVTALLAVTTAVALSSRRR